MLIAVGLNQKRAGVGDRELLAVKPEEMEAVVRSYASLGGVDEVMLLSTCYRVELYAATRCPAAAGLALRQALCGRAGGDLPLFEVHADEAVRHLLRVATSLESAVVGEPQILGQLKEAHAHAVEIGVAGRELNALMNRVFQVAKRVRTETAIGRAGVSWGGAAAHLAEKVLGPLKGKSVVVLGAGEMARVSAQHLRDEGARITVVNRTVENAEALAGEVGGVARPLDQLAAELAGADVLVAAAPVVPPALQPAAIDRLMRSRKRRSLVLVDLAVPRAVPLEVGQVEGVYLCDVDDLARLAEAAMAERAGAVAEVERIIDEELSKLAREAAERRAAPLIQAMRSRAQDIAREEVERTLKRLGEDPELETRLNALAGAIVSKILHEPSTRLRKAGAAGPPGDALLAAAQQIFDVSLADAVVQPRAR